MSSAHLTRLSRWLLSSPPAEWAVQRVRELLIGALRQGPIPGHVAFVMDGNRRYARTHHIETVEGHHLGFEALARILEVCYKSGVKVVTIYAFSIENFKRSKYEVDALMDMAKVKLNQLAQHGELLHRYGARIQILGQRDLVRPDVLESIDDAVRLTSTNTKAVLNVCFPYTSRHEMTHAIRETVREYSTPLRPVNKRPFSESHIARHLRTTQLSQVQEETSADEDNTEETDDSNISAASTDDHPPSSRTSNSAHSPAFKPTKPQTVFPDPETITSDTINAHTFTHDAPPCDLLVRTSGVQRLSDFMMWQCHEHTSIVFLECLWPDFDLWQFLPVLVEWQWKQRKLNDAQAFSRTSRPLKAC
ncbi:dehydrodolichyl diphosphate synthase, partial [Aureobasidium melanogenum]